MALSVCTPSEGCLPILCSGSGTQCSGTALFQKAPPLSAKFKKSSRFRHTLFFFPRYHASRRTKMKTNLLSLFSFHTQEEAPVSTTGAFFCFCPVSASLAQRLSPSSFAAEFTRRFRHEGSSLFLSRSVGAPLFTQRHGADPAPALPPGVLPITGCLQNVQRKFTLSS